MKDFKKGVWTQAYNFLNSLSKRPVELLLCPTRAFYAHFMYDLLFHKRSGLP
jgi:hypothetical protein